MKTVLIVIAIIIGVGLAFVALRVGLVLVGSGSARSVHVTSHVDGDYLLCTLTLQSDRPMSVVSLDAPRDKATALGLSAPSGFSEQPMPPDGDPQFAEEWNAENVRYAGQLELTPGVAQELRFPIAGDKTASVTIKGLVEGKWGLGGTATFFRVEHTGSPSIEQ